MRAMEITEIATGLEFPEGPVWMPDGTVLCVELKRRTVDRVHPDGRVETIVGIAPELSYDPSNRRLRGGRITVSMADGSTRPLTVEVVSDTGFHLGAGLYFGFDDHFHGEWRGDLVVDGERIADCSTPDNARRLHQIRDTVIHVTDPVGGGEGWGNMQPIITGDHPSLGLDGSTSFM